jgi:hypothetical protein
MFEVLQVQQNWWSKGDAQLEWWNHGVSQHVMNQAGGADYVSQLKVKRSDEHATTNTMGNSALYASNFSNKAKAWL